MRGVAAAGVPDHLFLIPKNVTSKRPIVLLPTLTRWWECSRGPVVKEWQERHRVSWDARARLLALEELNKRLGKRCWRWNSRHQSWRVGRGSGDVGCGLGQGLRACQSSTSVGVGHTLQLPEEDLAGFVRILQPSTTSARSRRSRPFHQGRSGVA